MNYSSSHLYYMPCPSYRPWLDHYTRAWPNVGVNSSHYAAFSSLHLSSVQMFSTTHCSEKPSMPETKFCTQETKFHTIQNHSMSSPDYQNIINLSMDLSTHTMNF
jgi:hypothetical protein